MRISQLIKKLNDIKDESGDLDTFIDCPGVRYSLSDIDTGVFDNMPDDVESFLVCRIIGKKGIKNGLWANPRIELPKPDKPVLFNDIYGDQYLGYMDRNKEWHVKGAKGETIKNVIGWMYTPDPIKFSH
jgi:hypothetical protein